jgi:hypothetical protein
MAQLTDLEITKLCAEAMGIEVISVGGKIRGGYEIAVRGGSTGEFYDPLHDYPKAPVEKAAYAPWRGGMGRGSFVVASANR